MVTAKEICFRKRSNKKIIPSNLIFITNGSDATVLVLGSEHMGATAKEHQVVVNRRPVNRKRRKTMKTTPRY